MKKLLLTTTLVAAASLGLEGLAFGHGGQYRGPGDTVPPGGGGGGGGGGPSAPGPTGPQGPGAVGPVAAGPGGPAGPAGAASNNQPVTGQGASGPDLTQWTFWWEFNKEPYLNLKSHIHSGGVQTGSDNFFIGQGQKNESKDTQKPTEAAIRNTVVPALLDTLDKETNNDIVTGCLIALAKIGDRDESGASEFEPVIAKRLNDPVQEIRETAAVALGILANESSIDTLEALLMDTERGRKLVNSNQVNYRTRSFAAYGLGLIGKRTAREEARQRIVRILVDAIERDDTSTRDLRVACLVSLGLVPLENFEPATPPAEGESLAPDGSRRGQLEYLMGFLGDEQYNFLVRAHVPTALARILKGTKDPEVFESFKSRIAQALMERAGKRSKVQNEIQQSAVLALGLLGDTDNDAIDKEIRQVVGDVPKELSDQQARNFAMIAMGTLGGHAGNGSSEDGVKEASKFLLRQLSDGKQTIQPWAALGIGVMTNELNSASSPLASDPSVLAMSQALRSSLEEEKNPSRLGAYAIAAGIQHDVDSLGILLDKLARVSDDDARGYVAVGLGLLGETSAKAPIQDIVKESKYRPDLLKQAAIALGLLGDKDLVDELITMLQEAKGLATQAAISSALGFIGDARSIDPLVTMLRNEDLTDRARGFAAVALGIVADKEPFPWNSKIAVDLNYRASTTTLNDTEGTGILNIL